jgi:small conductance mechanosensitive channel
METLAAIPFELDWSDVVARAIRIVVILGAGGAFYLLLRVLRNRLSRMGEDREDRIPDEGLQRRKTLAAVITTGGIALISTITFMMVVEELGIPLGPLLATAGIAGLAIGFGAQTLVQDVISGFFILLEDQYSIGDVIAAGGVDGVVEQVNLRTTILRDLHGVVHVIPNGEIRVLSNKTKEWSRAVLEIGVGYGEDPDRVIAILEEVAAEIHAHPVFGALLLEGPSVPGVEAFGEHRFDAEGIELPFPQRMVWHRGDPGAEAKAAAEANAAE